MKNWTIILFSKIQVDTVIAFFLLKKFGEQKFPGIVSAQIDFWSEIPSGKTPELCEEEGFILIDLGLGKFDHHRLGPDNKKFSASHLVAQELKIDDRPDLQRLLEFARRDDLEGKGTLSNDPIDRAFGLSGLISCLNKSAEMTPKRIVDIVIPLITGHYEEENRRYEALPKEFEQLNITGRVKIFNALQLGKQLKVVYIESDNPALAGFLRSRAVGADVVIQRSASGHVNFITKQAQRLQLNKLARLVKLLEASKSGITLNIDSQFDLEQPGRTEDLPQWYYDTRANTLQNGGLAPQGIPATKLTYEELEKLAKQGLNVERRIQPPPGHKRFSPRNQQGPRDRFQKGRGVVIIE